MCRKNLKFDIFKCCTASTTATGITLALDSVFLTLSMTHQSV